MQQFSQVMEREPRVAKARFTSHMHGERTKIEVYTRVPDNVYRTLALGKMELIGMRCGTIAMRRDAADIRARPRCIATFILQIRGRSSFRHYGNHVELEEGDITLCNNSTQYDLILDGPCEIILFRVPMRMINEAIPTPDVFFGQRLTNRDGLASTSTAIARDLIAKEQDQLSPEIAERAGRHLLEVIASSYIPLLDQRAATSAVMHGRFWKVKRFIEEHLRDPELSPSYIASQLGLSDRYLRMIFAVGNEAPSAFILRRRLEECAAQLRDPRWRHYSITNIAFGWGFNSAPHFARTFRARYACSPRDYRNKKTD